MSFRSFGRPVKSGKLPNGNEVVVYLNKPGMSKYETKYLVKEESAGPPYWIMYGVDDYKTLWDNG
jgi:hypothetical protein